MKITPRHTPGNAKLSWKSSISHSPSISFTSSSTSGAVGATLRLDQCDWIALLSVGRRGRMVIWTAEAPVSHPARAAAYTTLTPKRNAVQVLYRISQLSAAHAGQFHVRLATTTPKAVACTEKESSLAAHEPHHCSFRAESANRSLKSQPLSVQCSHWKLSKM